MDAEFLKELLNRAQKAKENWTVENDLAMTGMLTPEVVLQLIEGNLGWIIEKVEETYG